MTLALREADRPRIVWLFALLVFAFGCRSIAAREAAIADATSATKQLDHRIERNDITIARAGALRRREQLVRLDLLRVSGEQRPALSVAAFLRSLEQLASPLHLGIVSVTPSDESRRIRTGSSDLAPLPITVLLRGSFRDVVRFIQESTRQKSLAELENVQMAVSSLASTHRNALDATIRLTLYRVLLDHANAAAY